MGYNIPKLSRKEAEEMRDDLIWLLFDYEDMYPNHSLKELCEEVVISYKWVKEWSLKYPEWKDLFEYFEKEVEIPKLKFD